MAKLGISTGTVANDGTGDTLNQAGTKSNANFDEVYTYLGDGTNLGSTGTSQLVAGKLQVGAGESTGDANVATFNGSVNLNGGDIRVGGGASITGIATVKSDAVVHGNVYIHAGIVTAGTGVVTYFGDGGNLTGLGGAGRWTGDATGISTTKIVGINTIASSAGIALTVNGPTYLGGITTLSDDVTFLGQGQNIEFDKSDNLLWFKANTVNGQSAKAWWGDSPSYSNLAIYMNANGPAIIGTRNQNLQISSGDSSDINLVSSKDINFSNASGGTAWYLRCKENTNTSDQNVQLYYGYTGTEANDIRLSTTSGGIDVNGHVGASGSITGTSFYGDGSNLEGVASSGIGLSTRATITKLVSGIGIGATMNSSFTDGRKSWMLQKVGISSAARVVLYTDQAAMTADADRKATTDPVPGSGVIAEVNTSTAGVSTFIMSPGIMGWNNDATPSNNIWFKVCNNETSAANITVSLTIVQLEA